MEAVSGNSEATTAFNTAITLKPTLWDARIDLTVHFVTAEQALAISFCTH